jgi:hypothetical protein
LKDGIIQDLWERYYTKQKDWGVVNGC